MAEATLCERFVVFLLRYVISPLLLLPLLCVGAPFYRLYDKFKFEWFQGRRISSHEEHRRKVAALQEQVRARKGLMCTGKAAWNSLSMRAISKAKLTRVNVDHLNTVVEIDEGARVLTVEPGVLMGQLTSILLPRGWTIAVVPEFETLSVGGVICGTGIESGSTRAGLSADTALEYELVLGDGRLITCSATEHPDLFHSIPWSHGTLGFLTAVKFPLIPARKYVELEYHGVDSPTEARRLLQSQDHEFVEGIAFGPRSFVVTYGNMVDAPNPRRGSPNLSRWYKPFFFQRVKSAGRRKGKPVVDYIPLRDYYHRHTRAYFWLGPLIIPLIGTRLALALIGWILPICDVKLVRRVILALFPDRLYVRIYNFLSRSIVGQDFLIPLSTLEPAVEFLEKTVSIYPLWLCPCKFFRKPGMVHVPSSSSDAEQLFLDVGIYGDRRVRDDAPSKETIRLLEAFTMEQGGVQFLYADSYLSREEFRAMFDMSLYDEVRRRYGALEAFPDVYDKVSKAARGLEP